MTTIDNFNRIEGCDKLDSLCIDAYSDLTLDDEGALCSITSWGKSCIDLAEAVKKFESCTTLYLSPEDNPNCLVYEPEEKCGDNICIHGDDLSRIISMTKLKDVAQNLPVLDGDVYMYNSTTGEFEPYDLKGTVAGINTAIQNINATLSNLSNRLSVVEEKLTPPAGAPADVRVAFGSINVYHDPNVIVNETTGEVEQLDKNHGLYTHLLSENKFGDGIFG